MVDDLSQLRGQTQIAVHFLVKKRADACGAQAKRLGSKIQSLTNRSGLEMHVSISTIAVTARSIFKIADHGERQASVTRQVLPQTESRCYQALVSFLDFLELCAFRPVAVNPRRQACNAVDV